MKRYALLTTLLSLFLLLFVACVAPAPAANEAAPAAEEAAEVVAEEGSEEAADGMAGAELIIAIDNAYPPFSYIDTDTGEAIGYDYDMFNEICSRLNCTPVFQETSWDAIVAIMGGDSEFSAFDIGADGITITPERAEHIDFTRPYITISQKMLVRMGEDRFTNAEELAADSALIIGSQPGTTNFDLSVELVGEDRVVGYDQFNLAIAAMIQGDIDAVTIDNMAGLGFVNQTPDKLMLLEEPLSSEDLGFILPKGSDHTAMVNEVLDAMEADGTLDTLFEKWFSTDEE